MEEARKVPPRRAVVEVELDLLDASARPAARRSSFAPRIRSPARAGSTRLAHARRHSAARERLARREAGAQEDEEAGGLFAMPKPPPERRANAATARSASARPGDARRRAGRHRRGAEARAARALAGRQRLALSFRAERRRRRRPPPRLRPPFRRPSLRRRRRSLRRELLVERGDRLPDPLGLVARRDQDRGRARRARISRHSPPRAQARSAAPPRPSPESFNP